MTDPFDAAGYARDRDEYAGDPESVPTPPVTPVRLSGFGARTGQPDRTDRGLEATHTTDDRPTLPAPTRGDDLLAQTFPPLEWCVPHLIPEGLTLLVGAPKAGKSWLLLQVILAVAAGEGLFDGQRLTPRPVLHLALEDSPRRLRGRAWHLTHGASQPLGAWHHYTALPVGWSIPDLVDEWTTNHAVGDAAPLVIVDTLGKVRGSKRPQESSYEYDYRVAGALKGIADSVPGMAVVAAHHDRKANSADFVDDVSGTNGLAGAADTLVVVKRDRNESDAVLLVTGRDVDEAAYAATFTEGRWSLAAGDYAEARRIAAARLAMVGKGDTAGVIVAYLAEHGPSHPRDVAAGTGIDPENTRRALSRLYNDDRLDRDAGRYWLPTNHAHAGEATR